MKIGLRFSIVAICLAAILAVPTCFAQTTPFLGAGSTGAFNAIALGGASSINPVTVTGVTGNGTTATATCATTCGFTANEVISLVGTGSSATAPGFDQTNLTVISDSGTSFTFSSADTTSFSGTAFAGVTPTCANLPFSPTKTSTDVGTSATTFIWTDSGSGSGEILQGKDSRNASFVLQNAKGWVTWQTSNPWDGTLSQAGTTIGGVCEYLAVDSIVGLRLFFATNAGGTPAGTISFSNSCSTSPAGANEVPLFPADTALPTSVCAVINGLPFNAAPTDVAAEDGAYQVGIVCGTYAAAGTGYGLSCGRGGGTATLIDSGIASSGKSVQAVDFNIGGTDPVTSATVAHSAAGADGHPWVHLDGGGQAVLVIVNTSDTSSNGFGNASLTNVNRPTLARVFTGQATRTRDLFSAQGLGSKGLTALVREPLSGTYTTFQNQVTRTQEFNHSADQFSNNGGGFQLFGVGLTPCPPTGWTFGSVGCPAAASETMDGKKTSTGGLKVRVIGTGEMVDCVANSGCASTTDLQGNTLSNQIGFTFFSFGNVKPCTTGPTCKYLTVDGVDPLFANSSSNPGGAGVLPTCANPCPGGVTLANIINGSYPIWNILRVVTTGTLGAYTGTAQNPTCETGASVCQLVQEMQASYAQIPDLVPISSMQAFRQHITVTASTTPELGGDNYVAHNGYKHYGTGITGTPCGFAPITGATVQYECGRDAEGARQLIQEELDANTDYSIELTAGLQ